MVEVTGMVSEEIVKLAKTQGASASSTEYTPSALDDAVKGGVMTV